jgi:hypothetical protein
VRRVNKPAPRQETKLKLVKQKKKLMPVACKCANALPLKFRAEGHSGCGPILSEIPLLLVVHRRGFHLLAIRIGCGHCDRPALAVCGDHNSAGDSNLASFLIG